MITPEQATALQIAVLEWQKKYCIQDGDPMLASLELLHIYFTSYLPAPTADSPPPTFNEFRESLELLDNRSKQFIKQSSELIQEIRAARVFEQKVDSFRFHSLAFVASAGFVTGILAGKVMFQ